jgi:hypothetical protein
MVSRSEWLLGIRTTGNSQFNSSSLLVCSLGFGIACRRVLDPKNLMLSHDCWKWNKLCFFISFFSFTISKKDNKGLAYFPTL